MDGPLSGKAGSVALVTGGAEGIGWATALRLVRDFDHVVVLDIREEQARARAAELGKNHLGLGVDVSSEVAVNGAFEVISQKFGRVDVLVNNAGIPEQSGPTLKQDVAYLDRLFAVHVRGTFLMTRAAAALMLPKKNGAIVNVGSIVGVRGVPGRNGYGAAKAGIEAMTRAMACEWGSAGIRVNAILPGYVKTRIANDLIEKGLLDLESMQKRTPLGRLAEPAEIAEAIAFLASPSASFITGVSLMVDGGWAAWGAN